MNEKLFVTLQHILPQHLISRAAGWLADTEIGFIKNTFIEQFARRYQVDMSEALNEDLRSYENFNAFFTRALKADARPICGDNNSIVCPADGAISQLGDINEDSIFQAKGQSFNVETLLGGDSKLAAPFINGKFATVYLSPKDYHRVHMPLKGELQTMVHIPGKLFSVNTATTRHVPRLFARNERVAAIYSTEAGPMAVVMVGAMIVASIETTWAGLVTPVKAKVATTHYAHSPDADHAPAVVLDKGEEMGRFKLGSTAIVLFGNNRVEWDSHYQEGTATKMGESLGKVNL